MTEHQFFVDQKISFDLTTSEGQAAMSEWLQQTTPEGMLTQIETSVVQVLRDFGLATEDPVGLVCKPFYDESWPRHVKLCVEILYRLHETRRSMRAENLRDAVFNVLLMMNRWCDLRLHRYESLIWLGANKTQAAKRGAASTAKVRKEAGAQVRRLVLLHAQRLRAEGRAESSLAQTIAKRVQKSPKRVREILLEDKRREYELE